MFRTWDQMHEILKNEGFQAKLSSMITHTLPIRDIGDGMDLIRTKQAAKVSLKPEW
jgi:hypothetical protein